MSVSNVIAQEVNDDGTLGYKVYTSSNDPTKKPDSSKNTDEGKTAENGTTIYGLTFANNYEVTLGDNAYDPDTVDPENYDASKAALDITKTIVGHYADYSYAFPFNVTFTVPSNVAADDVKSVNAILNGEKITIDLTSATGYDFNLAQGGSLIIPQLPAGVTYTVNEKLADADVANVAKYQASYKVTGLAADTTKTTTATAGAGVSLATDTILLAEDGTNDVVAYTNTLPDADVTPTGILINNAPYIILAVIAIGGMTAYIVKRKNEVEE